MYAMQRQMAGLWRRKSKIRFVSLNIILLILTMSNLFCTTAQVVNRNNSIIKLSPMRITKPNPMPPLPTRIPITTTTTFATKLVTIGTNESTDTIETTQSPSLSLKSSTEINSNTSSISDICSYDMNVGSFKGATLSEENAIEDDTNVRYDRDIIQVIEGDIMLSVITTDPISALFVVNRINIANFIETDFKIGIRAIMFQKDISFENVILQEVKYHQQCIPYAIGIFVDFDIYQSLENFIKDLEYNIWPIPSTNAQIFPKVAHLLHQMPWGDRIASVEILTDHLGIYDEFMESVRQEQMCLMHFKSAENIYIVFGNEMAHHFEANGTIFAVPTERTDRNYIADLPENAYILLEKEVDLRLIDFNNTQITLNNVLIGKKVLPSRMFAFSRPFLDLMRWLKATLLKNCQRTKKPIAMHYCKNVLTFVDDWRLPEYKREHTNAEIIDLLHLQSYSSLINFHMYQKQKLASTGISMTTLDISASDEEHLDMREIASQNFVTNVTTYYHYNDDNQTSFELKMKFGQVFNCQYGARDNTRYPLLFDGESVMFWRIKPETWVATGMTAAILGVIMTLAILVFIVVRISLGDVFEGNPITSILLLISLIVLFTSFIPFSIEYVGERQNSHVTFEDAATLNTLCAIRVFILTLVYSFVFSLILSRTVMLASIGSEGGFLSHVNGYLQAVICVFSMLVQLCMSIQLLVILHTASNISCENIYYGNWLWALVAYDFILLSFIIGLVPFIYRSQRNYREGILIVIAAILMFIIWLVWISVALFGDEMRDAAIAMGMQATGWAILVGILIPRTFLIVRGIERSDIAQALPSLTSLAFAQNNQYTSEQSVYECVNPAMRQCSIEDVHQSPSEIPTLPLRGGGPRRQQFFANLRQANANINPQRPPPRPQRSPSPNGSMQSSLPPSPDNSKITRF